jgi:hypothetical protein
MNAREQAAFARGYKTAMDEAQADLADFERELAIRAGAVHAALARMDAKLASQRAEQQRLIEALRQAMQLIKTGRLDEGDRLLKELQREQDAGEPEALS